MPWTCVVTYHKGPQGKEGPGAPEATQLLPRALPKRMAAAIPEVTTSGAKHALNSAAAME